MNQPSDTYPLPTQPELLELVKVSPTPLWTAEPSGERRYFNPTWYSLTGRDANRELGHGWLAGVHPEDRERVEGTIHNACRSGHRYGTRYRLACRHDEWRELEEHGYPQLADGQIVSWFGTCRDTTQEQRERERYREFIALTNQVAEAQSSQVALGAILDRFDSSERRGAIFVLDSDGIPRLEAAPSIHELSLEAVSNCIRKAVETEQPVIASSLETESEPWGFALPNNEAPLIALWALPAQQSRSMVFVVFFLTSAVPSDDQVENLMPWTSLARLALRADKETGREQ